MPPYATPIAAAAVAPIAPTLIPQPDADAAQAPPSQPSSPGAAPTQNDSQDRARLQKYLDASLKSSDIKAEIENERNGGMIVRLVDSVTGKVFLQLPPPAVLALVADIERREAGRSGNAQGASDATGAGSLIDQFA